MIKIISDSTCDLSQEVLERYDIDIIPLHIVKGDEELEDGPQIDIHALYEWADKNKTTPKTSAPSIETAMNVMRPYIDEGREIICFSISSEMSTSINVIRMAAEELDAEDKVTVIDSRNLSTGIGLLVVEAAVMAADGKSREEIKAGIDPEGKSKLCCRYTCVPLQRWQMQCGFCAYRRSIGASSHDRCKGW